MHNIMAKTVVRKILKTLLVPHLECFFIETGKT